VERKMVEKKIESKRKKNNQEQQYQNQNPNKPRRFSTEV
jgi:hypothetical protein